MYQCIVFKIRIFMKNIRFVLLCSVFCFSSLFSMEQPEKVLTKVTKESILLVIQEVLKTGSLIVLDEHKKRLESYLLLTQREDALLFIKEQIGVLEVKMEEEELLIEKQLDELQTQRTSINSLDGSFELLLQEQEEQEEEWDLVLVEKE